MSLNKQRLMRQNGLQIGQIRNFQDIQITGGSMTPLRTYGKGSNFDGSFISPTLPSKAGWVIRDDQSTYKGAGQGKGFTISALEAEFQALIMPMQQCWCRGFTKVVFEGDNRKMMDILNAKVLNFGTYNWTREVRWWTTKFKEVMFRWIKRTGNDVADKLAKADIPNDASYEFYYYIPSLITKALHKDFVNSIN